MKYILTLLISLGMLTSCGKEKSVDSHAGHEHEKHADHQGHDDHEGHDHGHTDSGDGESNISPQAIKNMGVVIEEVDSSDYTVYAPVSAYLDEHPLSEQPVFAPFSGRVQDVLLEPGQYLEPGKVLVQIIRAPIARPELKLVEGILTPASEEYHDAIASLRSSIKSLEVLKAELKRLNQFKADKENLSIVPQKTLIDLRYSIVKKAQELDNYRSKLQFHGLSEEEVVKLEKGGDFISSPNLWINALKKNNIWDKKSTELFGTLPQKMRENHWVIATVGELSAEGLISKALIGFFRDRPKATRHFLDISSMLQGGRSLKDIKNLEELGALEKVIQVKVKMNKSGWDLEKIHVKSGQVVAEGETLFSLVDPTKIFLKAKPTGSEFVNINNAIKKNFTMQAKPLIPNSAPTLEDLSIAKIMGMKASSPTVYIPAQNSLLSRTRLKGVDYRNWSLHAGMKFTLQVPIKKLEDVIVLPSKAVIDHGADKVVFVREGKEFLRRKVVILHQDDEVVVIGEGSELLPEEAMVTHGAFALQLALIAGTPEAVDPHAGHNH